MRRVLPTSALVIAGLFATACSDQRSPLPTEPPPLSPSLTGLSCPSPLQLAALTLALFTPGDLLTFARSTQSNINLKMSRGDIAGARKLALAFVDFTLQSYYQGKLRDPNGANPPTTAEAVVTLIDGILCWVGLPPSGLDLTKNADVTVTTKVIGKDGGQLVAGDKLSGLKVTAGTVSEDALWVITRRDDLAKNGTCVSTTLTQIPLCIDFSVVPAQTVAKPVLVVICQPEDRHPLDRRLAHKLPDNKVELLAVVPDPFAIEVERIGLDCTTTPGFEPSGLGSIGRAVWQFGSLVMRVLGPKRLHASHSGLGGLLGPKLSPVTAVQVRLSFDVQPSNTEPSSPITPAVQVALRDLGTGAIATEITNRIKVGIGTNPGAATLGGDTIQSPNNGIATFANLTIGNSATGYTLVADALSSTFTGDSLIHTPATSAPFDVVSQGTLGFVQQPTSQIANLRTLVVVVRALDQTGAVLPGVRVVLKDGPQNSALGCGMGGEQLTGLTDETGRATFSLIDVSGACEGATLFALGDKIGFAQMSVSSQPFIVADIGGAGTAVIDGAFDESWARARCLHTFAAVPDGAPIPAMLCAMNDANNVYFLARFSRAPDPQSSVDFQFDQNRSGRINSGDDLIVFRNPELTFVDAYWFDSSVGECPPNALCDAVDVTDGQGAYGNNGGETVIEMSHPLRSGDGHDISVGRGQTIDFEAGLNIFAAAGSLVSTRTVFQPSGRLLKLLVQ